MKLDPPGFLGSDDFSMHSLPFHRLSCLPSNYFPLRASGADSCALSTVTPREKRVEHERETSPYRSLPVVKCTRVSLSTSDEFLENFNVTIAAWIATIRNYKLFEARDERRDGFFDIKESIYPLVSLKRLGIKRGCFHISASIMIGLIVFIYAREARSIDDSFNAIRFQSKCV